MKALFLRSWLLVTCFSLLGLGCSASVEQATCDSGQTTCDGVCTDVKTDAQNCGACGTSCGLGAACTAGKCAAASCAQGLELCGDSCIDTKADPANCGMCGKTCPSNE